MTIAKLIELNPKYGILGVLVRETELNIVGRITKVKGNDIHIYEPETQITYRSNKYKLEFLDHFTN